VLPKLHDASRYELEIQRARQSLTELTSGAVEFALEEVNEVIDGEIRPVALNLIAETRHRIEQEAAASLEALLHGEGASRLHQWFTDELQAHVPAMEARLRGSLESCHQAAIAKAKTQFESLMTQAAEQARLKCEEAVGPTLEAMNKRAGEVARVLNESVEKIELRLSGLLAEATSHAEAAKAALRQQVDELGAGVVVRIQKESGVLVDAACDQVLKANEPAEQKSAQVVGQTLEAMNKRADEVARGLNEKADEVEVRLSGLLAEATSRSEAASAAVQQQVDKLGDCVLERIQKESGALVDAACDRVLKANELMEQNNAEAAECRIKAMIQGLTESAEMHLQAMIEDKGKEFVDRMTQNRERLATETAAALRAKIAEILMAIQPLDASESPDMRAEAPTVSDAELVG